MQGSLGVFHAVVLFKARFQPFENFYRLLDGWLDHIHLLEAARQGRVFFEDAAVFGKRGGANALELPAGERGLEQVAGIHGAAAGRACANQCVDFVNEKNGLGLVAQGLEHGFKALLEVATVLGACQQRAHIECVHFGIGQHLGHVAFGDAPGQPFGNGGFAHACFAHQQRVVLAAAAQNLDDSLHLKVAADQRVDLALFGNGVEVVGVLLQRRGFFVALAAFFAAFAIAGAAIFRLSGFFALAVFADAVRDEVDHIQPRDALLVQVVHGV